MRRHLPEALQQRCTVHLQRNVLTKAPTRLRARLAREVSKVFDAPSKAEARRRLEQLRAGLGRQVPPRPWPAWRTASRPPPTSTPSPGSTGTASAPPTASSASTARASADPGGGVFPDRQSALRLVTAVALQATAIWTDRRYLDMSLLNPKEDTAKAA